MIPEKSTEVRLERAWKTTPRRSDSTLGVTEERMEAFKQGSEAAFPPRKTAGCGWVLESEKMEFTLD